MQVDSPEDLYGLPLPRFIPERQALVKALRSEKRREDATAVAGMRRPSVAAWAVNQLVRTQSKTIRALFEAGDDLAHAQSGAASGQRTADALRAATRRERDAIDDLLQAAEGLLSSDGHPLTAPTLERVRDTLRAASIDRASREQVADGCLVQELRFAGIGLGDQGTSAAESAPLRATKPKPKPAAKRRAAATEDETESGDKGVREAEAERKADAERKAEAAREAEAARQRKAALKAARQTETEARRAATRAEKELAGAEARRDEASAALTEAEDLLAAAAKRADETVAELTRAERSLNALDDAE